MNRAPPTIPPNSPVSAARHRSGNHGRTARCTTPPRTPQCSRREDQEQRLRAEPPDREPVVRLQPVQRRVGREAQHEHRESPSRRRRSARPSPIPPTTPAETRRADATRSCCHVVSGATGSTAAPTSLSTGSFIRHGATLVATSPRFQSVEPASRRDLRAGSGYPHFPTLWPTLRRRCDHGRRPTASVLPDGARRPPGDRRRRRAAGELRRSRRNWRRQAPAGSSGSRSKGSRGSAKRGCSSPRPSARRPRGSPRSP